MKKLVCGLILLFATALFAQQPSQRPPEGTPPTFPRDQAPEERTPPDQAPSQELSTTEVQHQIQEGLNSEPMLRDSNVSVHVNENAVMLSGTVDSEDQHDLALRIAGSYAGDRKIIDKIKLTQKT